MFITQAKEILESIPSARLNAPAAERLVHSIEDEEDQMLEPLLGYDLLTVLHAQYLALVEEYGGITTEKIPASNPDLHDVTYTDEDGEEATISVADQKKTIQLLRTMQTALVFRMLANKIYSLSTSFNIGAGASRASAGDYEPADDKHLQELRKEYFMNSKRACDQVLILLERDAKNVDTSLWYSLWKDSDSFYYKEDLLFPTMRVLTKFYSCNEPSKFISLYPTIRYCQDTYIAPRIDDSLLSALLDPSHQCSDRELEAQKKLRVALAYYVRAKEAPRDERNESLMTADSAMSTALAFIEKAWQEDDTQDEVEENQTTQSCPVHSDPNYLGNYCGEQSEEPKYDTFCTLFNPALNRW